MWKGGGEIMYIFVKNMYIGVEIIHRMVYSLNPGGGLCKLCIMLIYVYNCVNYVYKFMYIRMNFMYIRVNFMHI